MALSLTWLRREKGLHEVPCCGWPHNTATIQIMFMWSSSTPCFA